MKSSFSLLRSRDFRSGRRPSFLHDQHRKKQKCETPTPTNPIQNQFTVLSNQRDNFIREKENAEKELQRIQKEHQSIKKEHHALFESNRKAKQELGQKMEKLSLLKEEESRLKRLTENEFKAIRDCTKHSKVLEERRVESTKKYTAEMDPLNFELAALLKHRIQKKTERCITLRSVQQVVLPAFNKLHLLKQRKELRERTELLKSASEKHLKCIARLGELRCEYRNLAKMSDSEYQRLLKMGAFGPWEYNSNRQRNHADLFYGHSEGDQSQCPTFD